MTSTPDRDELVRLLAPYDLAEPTTEIADEILAAGFSRPVETELEGTTFADDIDTRREEYRLAISEAAAVGFGAQPDAGPVFLDIADAILAAVREVAAAPVAASSVEPAADELEDRWDADRIIPEYGADGHVVDVYARLDTAVRDYHEEIGTGGIVESWVVAVDVVEGPKSRTGAIAEKFATQAHTVGMLSEAILAVRLSGGESA